jgi:ppGpp synthetase/RelA/SpoT-type nucleotidyltranferase
MQDIHNFPNGDLLEDPDDRLIVECYNLERLSEDVRKKFQKDLQRIAQNRPRFYAFKHRNKGAKSILSKVLRKRNEGAAEFSPNHITDAWGCRLVTLFQADVVRVFEDLLKYVEGRRRRSGDLEIMEINVYDNRPENDPLSIGPLVSDLRRRFMSADVKDGDVRKSRESGYSSIHIILRGLVEHETSQGAAKSAWGVFEVQIRDIFEEGWSEISHQLCYGLKDDPTSSDNAIGDQAWMRLLNALKTVADGCSQHASLIEPIANGIRGEASEARISSITNLDEDQKALLSVLPRERQDLIRAIDEAYDFLEVAHRTSEERLDRSLGAPFYRAASHKFAKAVRLAGPLGARLVTPDSLASPRPVSFILRLEQANAAMFSLPANTANDHGEYDRAMSIYRQLTFEVPDDAFSHYRMGQACVRSGSAKADINEGVRALRRSLELTCRNSKLSKDHWLYISIPTYIGRGYYRLYSLALTEGDKAGALQALSLARLETSKIIDPDAIRSENDSENSRVYHRAVGNKLNFTYLLKAADDNSIHPERYTDEEKRDIAECVDLLSEPPLDAYANIFVESVDTIMIGAFILGRMDLAMVKAYDSINFLRAIAQRKAGRKANVNLESHLDENGKAMLRRAVFVITKGWSNSDSTNNSDDPTNSRSGLARWIRFWDR